MNDAINRFGMNNYESINRFKNISTLNDYSQETAMKYDDTLYGPSDRQQILDYIDELESEHPYKVSGSRDTYSQYNEAWCDALNRVRSFIEAL